MRSSLHWPLLLVPRKPYRVLEPFTQEQRCCLRKSSSLAPTALHKSLGYAEWKLLGEVKWKLRDIYMFGCGIPIREIGQRVLHQLIKIIMVFKSSLRKMVRSKNKHKVEKNYKKNCGPIIKFLLGSTPLIWCSSTIITGIHNHYQIWTNQVHMATSVHQTIP